MNKPSKLSFTATSRWIVGLGLILITFCSCKTSDDKSATDVAELTEIAEAAKTSEVVLETAQAVEVLKRLHDKGHLPGDSKDSHGQVTCEINPLIVLNKVVEMTYPESRTFHIVTTGETSTNNYTLVKLSKDSAWQLQKAWRTDSKGRTTEEWQVK